MTITLADWEPGHLLAELRSGRFTGTPFDVVAVAESVEPVVTTSGLRLLPDSGADRWDAPVQFARATLELLGLMPAAALDAYEGVFARGDASCYPALMEAAA